MSVWPSHITHRTSKNFNMGLLVGPLQIPQSLVFSKERKYVCFFDFTVFSSNHVRKTLLKWMCNVQCKLYTRFCHRQISWSRSTMWRYCALILFVLQFMRLQFQLLLKANETMLYPCEPFEPFECTSDSCRIIWQSEESWMIVHIQIGLILLLALFKFKQHLQIGKKFSES